MATEKNKQNQKGKQLSLAEYAKIKEQRAKQRLKLNFPKIVQIFFILPFLYILFLVFYYIFYLRFLTEH